MNNTELIINPNSLGSYAANFIKGHNTKWIFQAKDKASFLESLTALLKNEIDFPDSVYILPTGEAHDLEIAQFVDSIQKKD